MSGVNLMASQIGGAIAPLLVLPIQMRYGWRMSFFVFGVAGLVWAAVWYAWFRDSPEEKRGLDAASDPPTRRRVAAAGHAFPWRVAFRSTTVWAMLGVAFCYVYVYNFFQTWFHTFLVRGRGFSEANLLLSALPFVVAACANLAGGAASDALVRRLGAKRGRRVDRRHRAGGRGGVHRRGDAHAASVAHRGLPRPDLRRHHLPAVRACSASASTSAGRAPGRWSA